MVPRMGDKLAEERGNVVWVLYTWRLPGLDTSVWPPREYRFRAALGAEAGAVIQVVMAAYAADPAWRGLLEGIRIRMTERIQSTIGDPNSRYLVAEYQGSIAAASGIAKSHWVGQNFLTGIRALPEHQQRGLGKYLLALSLQRLREMGLETARVYTEAGSVADSKLYPLFGSSREEGVEYLGLRTPAHEGGGPQ